MEEQTIQTQKDFFVELTLTGTKYIQKLEC